MADEYEWQALPAKLLANCIFNYNVPPKELSGLSIFLGKLFNCFVTYVSHLKLIKYVTSKLSNLVLIFVQNSKFICATYLFSIELLNVSL